MAIDMYEHRFRQEIGRNPAFVMPTENNPAVWREGFPAWRALFTSMLHWGHSTGYRVPDFAKFCRYVENAYTVTHPDRDRYRRYFEPPLREAMRRRIGVWYNSGMAEHHVYLALVQAIEDANPKVGLVFYDARQDWKMKCDAYVICKGLQFKVNVYQTDEKTRPKVEQDREETEYARKRNTLESSHWCNDQADAAVDVSLSPRGPSDLVDVNGVRLFSHAAINRLLGDIYTQSGVYDGFLFGPKTKGPDHHLAALASP